MNSLLRRINSAYFDLFREYPILLRLAIITGVAQTSFALLNMYALPVFFLKELKSSGVALGAVISTFLWCEMLLKFVAGKLSDRYGRKPFVVFGTLLICLNPIIIIHLPQRLWSLVYPIRAIDGAGAAALWPPLFAMVGDVIRLRSRTAAMSVMNMVYVGAIGVALGAGPVLHTLTGSYHLAFYASSALLVLSSVIAHFGIPKNIEHHHHNEEEIAVEIPAADTPQMPALPQNGRAAYPLWMVLLVSVLMMMSVTTIANFLIVYLETDLGLSPKGVLALLIALGVPVAVLALPLGHAADRWGKSIAVRISLAVTAVVLWLIPQAHPFANYIVHQLPWFHEAIIVTILGIILVISHILGTPAWLALVSDLAPAKKRGSIMGMVATLEGFGAAIGPLIGGRLWDINHTYIFFGAGAIMSVAAIIALLTLRDGPTPNQYEVTSTESQDTITCATL